MQTGPPANGFNVGTQVSGQIVFYANGAERIRGSRTMLLNAWNHIAFVRNNGVLKGYLNGVQDGSSFTDTHNYSATTSSTIGSLDGGSEKITGFIDNFRITKAVRYLGNFTVPTR